MYWVDRSTGEIVSERDKNKPLWAYYEYLRGYGGGVVIENYIIGENPFCRIDFAYCVGDKYVNLKRDCHFKNHGVDRKVGLLCEDEVGYMAYGDDGQEMYNCVAWMPLPEPYKGE